MAYVIRSPNRRTTICTATAEAAAAHVERYRLLGEAVVVVDMNGVKWEFAELVESVRQNTLR